MPLGLNLINYWVKKKIEIEIGEKKNQREFFC